ncbi:receptor like protein kinase S.2 [Punica granatum]|uniref:Protein kinase domain-containing protein n=2 Tax=Punica granatum TaxID=22663 RepID=A0A218XPT6_PUNGR|nr:receptor like protein kinase S.2 [Punica granatum]OWM86511.1 hypothetical protein CDL15_Pgr026403 [Punica granatum]PKI75070.1 hypothetical protein CRG98_004544 [Punica granatum]
MQLDHRLCFILPPDSGDLSRLDAEQPKPLPKVVKPKKKLVEHDDHNHRGCGKQVQALLRELLARIYDSKWLRFLHQDGRPGKDRCSGPFFDMDGVQLSDKVGMDNPRIFSYAELYIGSKGFSDDEVLGSGGFGRVYRTVLPSDGTVVAVKCVAEKGERFEKTFAAELAAVAHLRHRNLVRLRGWCVHEDELLLVYDYMPNRSLDRVLFRRPENDNTDMVPISWDRRRKIINGLAVGLHYLHEQLETQIIHRDVKTSNVMLDSDFNARLGDFGLARWLEHELQYQSAAPRVSLKNRQFRLADTTRIGGTIGYLPPESFERGTIATAKSDVFSFGIVVLEVASGRRAVDLTYTEDQIVLLDWVRRLSDEGKLLQAGDNRLPDGSFRLSEMEEMVHLGLLCTFHNPQSRPSMKWVVEALSSNIAGKLPALPALHSHPQYISLSSSSNTTISTATSVTSRSTTTTSTASSQYHTAIRDTIYATAEKGYTDSNSESTTNGLQRRRSNKFFIVETPREISYKELVSATNNFSESRRVAELDFGTAYYGILGNNHHQILVKRLGMNKCPALRARFSDELQNLGRLRHRNLVQLRGWCTEQGEMLVVYDYSATRLLSHLLFDHHHERKPARPVLRWHHKYNIIRSLASAILYLHEEWDEQVIHRNITSSAIILDPDMNPRLGCFALAEFLTRNDHAHKSASKKSKSVRGIFGYMSPEYIESGEATTKADVYSFGVVILEILTGQLAVDFRRKDVLLVRKAHEVEPRSLEEMIDLMLIEEGDQREMVRLVKLGIACTKSNPESRPSMRQIVSILDGNDTCFTESRDESMDEWRRKNATALSLIRSMQALGIQ